MFELERSHIDVGVWGLLVRLAVLVEHARLDHGFLERSSWSETPLFRVDVALHDNSLDLGDDTRKISEEGAERIELTHDHKWP